MPGVRRGGNGAGIGGLWRVLLSVWLSGITEAETPATGGCRDRVSPVA